MYSLPIGVGYSLQHGPQIVPLCLGQIHPVPFGEDVEQEDRDIVSTEKGDDAIAAALAFPTSGEADFPCSACAGNDDASGWMVGQIVNDLFALRILDVGVRASDRKSVVSTTACIEHSA